MEVCLYHKKCLFEGHWENKPKCSTSSVKNSRLSRLIHSQGAAPPCLWTKALEWVSGDEVVGRVLLSGLLLRSSRRVASLQVRPFTFPLARGVTWQLRAKALRGFLLSLDTDRLHHGPTLHRENIPSFHDITQPGMEGEEGAQLVATAVPSAAV